MDIDKAIDIIVHPYRYDEQKIHQAIQSIAGRLSPLEGNGMLTVTEAMQRARVNGLSIRRHNPASTSWIVTLVEWTGQQCLKFRYITDDLEDAVISGSKMRRDAAKYI